MYIFIITHVVQIYFIHQKKKLNQHGDKNVFSLTSSDSKLYYCINLLIFYFVAVEN